jgi:hypothetical protein
MFAGFRIRCQGGDTKFQIRKFHAEQQEAGQLTSASESQYTNFLPASNTQYPPRVNKKAVVNMFISEPENCHSIPPRSTGGWEFSVYRTNFARLSSN